METSTPAFMIREIPVYGRLILAPMDGFTDWPMRSICREFGSAMSYSEFLNGIDITRETRTSKASFTSPLTSIHWSIRSTMMPRSGSCKLRSKLPLASQTSLISTSAVQRATSPTAGPVPGCSKHPPRSRKSLQHW